MDESHILSRGEKSIKMIFKGVQLNSALHLDLNTVRFGFDFFLRLKSGKSPEVIKYQYSELIANQRDGFFLLH